MSNYFVAPTATGAGDGSSVTDAATIAICNGIDHADNTVIILKSEVDYPTTTLTLAGITNAGGTGSGITVRASEAADDDWGDGTKDKDTVTAPAGYPYLDANNKQAIRINNANITNLTVQYLDCRGSDYTTWDILVEFKGMNGLTLEYLYLDGTHGIAGTFKGSRQGIYINSVLGDITIDHCDIRNMYRAGSLGFDGYDHHGLYFTAGLATPKTTGTVTVSDTTIANVDSDCIQAKRIRTTTNITDCNFGPFGENAADLKGCSYWTFDRCTMTRSNWAAGGSGGGIVHVKIQKDNDTDPDVESSHNTIKNCYIHTATDATYHYVGVQVENATATTEIYQNKFKGLPISIAIMGTATSTKIYNNEFILNAEDDQTGIKIGSYSNPSVDILNNSFYLSGSDMLYAIRWEPNSGSTGGTIRNNAIYTNRDNSGVYGLYVENQAGEVPTVSYNVFHGAHTNRILWKGTTYDSTELAAWESAEATVSNNIFDNPDFNNVALDELWTLTGGPCINAGTTVVTSVLGLRSTSDWTSSPITVVTISRIDQAPYDIGAYEYTTTTASASPTAVAPLGTYLGAWGGEYPNDTLKMWINNGNDKIDGSNSGMIVSKSYAISGSYGGYSNGTADNEIEWDVTGGDVFSSAVGTVWMDVRPVTSSVGYTRVFNAHDDSNNSINLEFRDDNEIWIRHEGNNLPVTFTSTATFTDNVSTVFGFAWDSTNNKLAVKVGDNAWEEDAGQTVTAFTAGEPATIQICAENNTHDPFWIDSVSIHDTYKATRPDWTYIDNTVAPTITDIVTINNINTNASVTTNPTSAWSDSTARYIGFKISEQIINYGNPDFSRLKLLAGPSSTDYKWCYYNRQIQIGSDWYLAFKYDPQIGNRSTDLSSDGISAIDMNTATMQDGDGNDLIITQPRADIGGTGVVTLALPYPNTNPKEFDATNTMSTWLAASAYPVQNDFFKWTENATDSFDVSNYDGIIDNPITLNGRGFIIKGQKKVGDYYIIKNFIFKY